MHNTGTRFKLTMATVVVGAMGLLMPGSASASQIQPVEWTINFWDDFVITSDLNDRFPAVLYASQSGLEPDDWDQVLEYSRNSQDGGTSRWRVNPAAGGEYVGAFGGGNPDTSYDPSVHGPLEHIETAMLGRRGSDHVAVKLLIEQNGRFYKTTDDHMIGTTNLSQGDTLWETSNAWHEPMEGRPLVESDFVEWLSDGTSDAGSTPDFGGDVMNIGFSFRSGRSWTRYIQEWNVVATPVPEPGSLAMMGMAGLLMLQRRRR